MIPPAHKAHQTVSFSGCNGVSTYTCGLASLQMRQFFFVDVAIQPEVHFIAKQNSLMKIGNNGNLVLGPFDESTPCLMIVLMNCQTKLRINHLTAVKSVAILEKRERLIEWSQIPMVRPAINERTCREWFQRFKNGDFDVEDQHGIWWDQLGVVYYEFLKPTETITGDRYRT
ncbi:alpha-2 adrenergic receptor [Trichonephila clavipes]|nr:alpha-2 adrenergic receptor [Trichonephila clavipes]